MGVIHTPSGFGLHHNPNGQEADEEDKIWERLGLLPLMATLLLPIIIGAIIVVKCVFGQCFAKKTNSKEEMYGVEGKMTMLSNSDAFVVPSASSSANNNSGVQNGTPSNLLVKSKTCHEVYEESVCINNSPRTHNNNNLQDHNRDHPVIVSNESLTNDARSSVDIALSLHRELDASDTLKRGTGKRQLPDLPELPLSANQPPRRSSSVLSHDGTSELYATVGDVPNPYAHLKNRLSVPNDVCQPSTSRGIGQKLATNQKIEPNPSSDSDTYAVHHPYARLKKNTSEHPYARVQNSSVVNDEETDTDNYDIPQPYAQTGGGSAGTSATAAGVGTTNQNVPTQGPVPPRRIGRQWRRGSQPQAQNSVDSTSHFSGDSQDSRGYTSISVREPLSNIRGQMATTRSRDPHYATVSDDSEEMYAAIDDPSESNYMQIVDGERLARPLWLDAANMASPIPERREANSPLPPVPAVPPPVDGMPPAIAGSSSPIVQGPQTPPVYAIVTKKNKKSKAVVTPTNSNASTSSQTIGKDNHSSNNTPSSSTALPQVSPTPIVAPTATAVVPLSHHHHHRHHHRSKSRTLMDNSNLLETDMSDHRRWSKADINYSEFEVVREPYTNDIKKSPLTLSLSGDRHVEEIHDEIPESIVDEDNYNVIADSKKAGYHQDNSSTQISRSADTEHYNNYQEIESVSNTYQEIEAMESTGYYQEIGAVKHGRTGDDEVDEGSGLYQEIKKRGDEGDEEDDDDDQFYEKVRPAPQSLSVGPPHKRKHGYEKLKRKTKTPSPRGRSGSSDEDDEEERGDEDLLYEKVKYPPYERLKESRSDLAVDRQVDDEENTSNYYERIGYSKTKKVKTKSSSVTAKDPKGASAKTTSSPDETVDVHQLYAVVDKSKKKRTSEVTSSNNNYPPPNCNNNNNTVMLNVNRSSSNAPSPSPISTSSFKTNVGHTAPSKELCLNLGPDLEFIDDNNDIEYI